LDSATVSAVFPCITGANFQAGQILVIRRAAGYLLPDPTPDGNLTDALTKPGTRQSDYGL
jgi:hypothetical protein